MAVLPLVNQPPPELNCARFLVSTATPVNCSSHRTLSNVDDLQGKRSKARSRRAASNDRASAFWTRGYLFLYTHRGVTRRIEI
ncbi:hypothetical protein MPTK2_3g10610 [Marchantia polymorpha subsp. ruderalis]